MGHDRGGCGVQVDATWKMQKKLTFQSTFHLHFFHFWSCIKSFGEFHFFNCRGGAEGFYLFKPQILPKLKRALASAFFPDDFYLL